MTNNQLNYYFCLVLKKVTTCFFSEFKFYIKCWQPSTQLSFRQLSSVIGPCCNLNIVNCILNRPKLTFQMESHIAGLNRHLLSNRPKSLLNFTKVLNSDITFYIFQHLKGDLFNMEDNRSVHFCYIFSQKKCTC